MQDPCLISAKDAMTMLDLHMVAKDDALYDALQAVVDAKEPARPLLLDMALTRLEFQEAVAPDGPRRTGIREAIAYVKHALEMVQ